MQAVDEAFAWAKTQNQTLKAALKEGPMALAARLAHAREIAGPDWAVVPRPVMQIALLVLEAARTGQSWNSNFLKDFDCATAGLRDAMLAASEKEPGQ